MANCMVAEIFSRERPKSAPPVSLYTWRKQPFFEFFWVSSYKNYYKKEM